MTTFAAKDWRDFPDTSTPITALALEDLEVRLAAYVDERVPQAGSSGLILESNGSGDGAWTSDSGIARYANAGTFTKKQTVAPDSDVSGLVLKAPSGQALTPALKITDNSDAVTLEAHVGDDNTNPGRAGLKLHQTNATNAPWISLYGNNGAWGIGLDVAHPTAPYKDFFIGKHSTVDPLIFRDIIYIRHGGAGEPMIDLFPPGYDLTPDCSVSISGKLTAAGDPPELVLQPVSSQTGDVFRVQVLSEANARLSWGINGSLKWGGGGGTAPGGLLGAAGSTLDREAAGNMRFSHGGAGITTVLVLHNSHTLADGDGPRLSFQADGNEMARLDAVWDASVSAGYYTATVRGPSNSRIERMRLLGGGTVGARFSADADATVPLVARGFSATQSGSLIEARSSADAMKFKVAPAGDTYSVNYFNANNGTANAIYLGHDGSAVAAAIAFGSALDVHLKRQAADYLASNAAIGTKRTSAPADGSLAAGQLAIWFDQTNGASKLMIKAKQADGTVKTASVALA